jgi:hypothetical protein
MDHIDELTDKMINFLNEMSEFDIYGLSLKFTSQIILKLLFQNFTHNRHLSPQFWELKENCGIGIYF